MSITAVIHQPDFLSYLGFFQRFLCADKWVILDNVQFVTGTAKSWQNRDTIKTAKGKNWLTVSVQKAPFGTMINEIMLSENEWRKDNLNLIYNSYRKALYFNEIVPHIEELYAFQCHRLMEFNLKTTSKLMELFDINIESVMASELNPSGKSNELLVDILRKVNADQYLSGVGARAYFDPAPFVEAGIEVIWQEFKHPVYTQLYGEFIPYLSAIDLLFNAGIEESRRILRSC